MRPDIIINPHAIPTRMTIGQLVECIVGKACLHNGLHGDCTAFNSNKDHLFEFQKLLTKSGMHSSGNDILYNGMTGEQIESEIFMGPTYYMRLKHMVKDKVNFRARGPMTQLTRQPVSGRANDGGLRIGEMERDSIISHGATEFLKESMLVRGDQFYMAVCNKTGGIAIYNPDQNMFMSPLADGPLKFVDSLDGTSKNIEHVTKYGRSFSVVRVPYVFKLFMHELQAMNVKMAVITEDNIDQFDNMNFSKNISLLTHGKTIDEFVEDVMNAKKTEQIKFSQEQYLSNYGDNDDYDPELFKPTNVEMYNIPSDYDLPNDLPNDVLNESSSSLLSSIPSPPASLQTTDSSSSDSSASGSSASSDTSSGTQQFKVGGAVNFKGDYKQDRKWNIKEFEKGFAILETGDKEGLESNIKVAGLADIKPYVEPQIQIQPQQSPQQVPVVLNMYNVNGNENTLQPQPQVALQPQVDSQQQFDSQRQVEPLDFSQPKIKIKEPESQPNLIKGGTIVVKKI